MGFRDLPRHADATLEDDPRSGGEQTLPDEDALATLPIGERQRVPVSSPIVPNVQREGADDSSFAGAMPGETLPVESWVAEEIRGRSLGRSTIERAPMWPWRRVALVVVLGGMALGVVLGLALRGSRPALDSHEQQRHERGDQ